jgi:catechol 2,3-dioxygenase-like lactoylglutathione lyase family enzyme
MMRFLAFLTILAATASQSFAQLTAPNEAGVTMGHIHLYVHDIESQQHFWEQVGATTVKKGKLQLPGVYVVIRQQDPTGGSVGSVIDHVGLYVKKFDDWMPKWKGAGIKIEAGRAGHAYLYAPEDIKVEITENTSLPTQIAMHHVHLFVPDPQAAQVWYSKNFGAVSGQYKSHELSEFPGGELSYTKVDTPLLPSKGRSLEHIGFEIKDLDHFVQGLEKSGIHTEAGVRVSQNDPGVKVAHLTDPWGVRIELTQGEHGGSEPAVSR